MRAIAVTCPQCGATLRVEGDVASVTCSYCGTAARIQQRTRVFQVPRPMPPPGPAMPPGLVARQKVSPAVFALPIVISMAAVGGGALFASRAAGVAQRTAQEVQRATQSPQQVTAAAAKARAGWWGETPILTDADGDGADDLVGLVRYAQDNDRAHLAAYSGKTGAQLWESAQLGTGANLTQSILGKAGDVVLMATEDGMLQTFDRRDGAARLKMSMGEKVQAMCAGGGAGEVVILTADDRWTVVDAGGKQHVGTPLLRLDRPGSKPKDALSRFRAIGAEVPPGLCVPVDNNHWQKPAALLSIDRWARLPELPGMSISLLVRHPGGPVAAIGSKRPGTAVPMLARLDGDKARWTAEIPASDPLTARADERTVGMSATAIYAVYSLSNPSRERLAAFSLEDGRRLWDQPIEHGTGSLNVVAVVATGDIVVVVAWSALRAFDQQDGTTRFGIGSF